MAASKARFLTIFSALVSTTALAQPKYPPIKAGTATDTYFGKSYPDPYRALEDLKNPEVQAWFKANAELTDGLLAKLPGRDALIKEWTELDKRRPASYSGYAVEAGRVFYKKTLGGENVGKLYYRDGWTGAEKLLFDPGTYKPGVVTTIQQALPSWDGKRVVLGLSSGGAEFSELRVLDVATGKLGSDSIYPSYAAYSWLPDSTAFLYDAGKITDIKSPEIELNRKTRLHVVGKSVEGPHDVLSNESNPELGIAAKEFPQVIVDETMPEYLIGNLGTVQTEQRVFYAPIAALGKVGPIPWKPIAQLSDNLVRSFAIDGTYVYGITHTGAPHYKLVRTPLAKPDWSKAEVVLPEGKDSIVEFNRSKHYLVVTYTDGINAHLVRYELATGKVSDVPLPVKGDVGVKCPDPKSDRCIVGVASWTVPGALFELDAAKGTVVKSVFDSGVKYPELDALTVDEVEVPGHDGAMIPLSIIHRKDLVKDGSTPTILEGYGAYGISYTPYFDVMHAVALHGVIYAYAHVRGGSEKGEAWYRAGYKATKPNTWKDFIAAGEYLVKQKYTSAAHLAGIGTSAGGVLISRAIEERPELFAAAVCNVCVANVMRVEFSPNGPVNTPEFGTITDAKEIGFVHEMDGVQHVVKGTKYPALMGVGGWNDPRVVPWEPGKLVAAMQAASTSGKPVLMKVNYDDGHFTEEKKVTFANFASIYAFLLWQTGHREFQPSK